MLLCRGRKVKDKSWIFFFFFGGGVMGALLRLKWSSSGITLGLEIVSYKYWVLVLGE